MANRPLPPLPIPKRSITPPPRKSLVDFELDAPTPTQNPTFAHFSALAQVFDALDNQAREELTELGYIVGILNAHERRVLIRVARKLESGDYNHEDSGRPVR